MSLVWDSTVPAPERFTLVALADRADEEGECWPSIPTLARKCRTGESTVRRHIKSLQVMGVLSVAHRLNNSSVYRISLARLRELIDPSESDTPCQIDTPPQGETSQIEHPSQSEQCTPPNLSSDPSQSERLSIRDTSVDPPVRIEPDPADGFLLTVDGLAAGGVEAEFEIWWKQWPRKIAKPKALESYRKARKKKIPAELLLSTASQQLAAWRAMGRDKDKIPHGATWLNQERWNDEVEKPKFRVIDNPASPWDGVRVETGGSPWSEWIDRSS